MVFNTNTPSFLLHSKKSQHRREEREEKREGRVEKREGREERRERKADS